MILAAITGAFAGTWLGRKIKREYQRRMDPERMDPERSGDGESGHACTCMNATPVQSFNPTGYNFNVGRR